MYKNFFYFAAGYFVCKNVAPVIRVVINKEAARLHDKKAEW